jgi:phospholipid transport system substrate-binding protein
MSKPYSKLLLLLAGLWVCATASAAFAARGDNPVTLLKRSTENVQTILNRDAATAAQLDKRDADLKREVNQFIDFDELGNQALGSHREAISPEQRTEFLGLLRDLIETAYTTRIKEHSGFKVDYTKEEINGEKAYVATTAHAKTGSGKLATEYFLHKVNGQWFVWDLVIEGSSLVTTYKTSFNKIIKQHGFEELRKRVKNKADELRKEKQLAREKADAPAVPASAAAQAAP